MVSSEIRPALFSFCFRKRESTPVIDLCSSSSSSSSSGSDDSKEDAVSSSSDSVGSLKDFIDDSCGQIMNDSDGDSGEEVYLSQKRRRRVIILSSSEEDDDGDNANDNEDGDSVYSLSPWEMNE